LALPLGNAKESANWRVQGPLWQMPLGILEDNASSTTTLEFNLLIEGSHEMFSHDLDLYAVSLGKILHREALTSEKLIGDVCENGVV